MIDAKGVYWLHPEPNLPGLPEDWIDDGLAARIDGAARLTIELRTHSSFSPMASATAGLLHGRRPPRSGYAMTGSIVGVSESSFSV